MSDKFTAPTHTSFLTGIDILRHPRFNKGLAFTKEERKLLRLDGLLPHTVITQDMQVERVMRQLQRHERPIDKYTFLIGLSDRNEYLFYRVLMQYTAELMPIVYTPTVGQACETFGHIYRRPKGLYITMEHKGRVAEVLASWPEPNVRAIVFTDGERILGLGDLGTYGMGIPVGKLMLYTCCGGVAPASTLPVTLDVGTNNKEFLKDPFYTGIRQERVRGAAYDELVAEFMEAAARRFGRTVLLQFEDFGNQNAFRLLEQYKNKYCTFNDDIQGTASVVVAGLYAAAPLTGLSLRKHRFVFYGAGEAGIGIAKLISLSISQDEGVSEEEARKNIFLVDSHGLVVKNRSSGNLTAEKLQFAHEHKEVKNLEDIVREVKATAIIGVAAVPGVFTEPVCKQMAKNTGRPIIFALSNPTSKAECTAENAYKWTGGKAVFASGSPFAPVTQDGRTYVSGQGNNAYIFPGVALGVIAAGSRHVTDRMFYLAAKGLAAQVTEADLAAGTVYPPLANIRQVSAKLAAIVAKDAYATGLATYMPEPADMKKFIESHMFVPDYPKYI